MVEAYEVDKIKLTISSDAFFSLNYGFQRITVMREEQLLPILC